VLRDYWITIGLIAYFIIRGVNERSNNVIKTDYLWNQFFFINTFWTSRSSRPRISISFKWLVDPIKRLSYRVESTGSPWNEYIRLIINSNSCTPGHPMVAAFNSTKTNLPLSKDTLLPPFGSLRMSLLPYIPYGFLKLVGSPPSPRPQTPLWTSSSPVTWYLTDTKISTSYQLWRQL